MDTSFFERPILNSPYAYPGRHWELDADGQPTGLTIDTRREAKFITPIPRPKKHKRARAQAELVFDEGAGVSTAQQQYDPRRSSTSSAAASTSGGRSRTRATGA